jgi:hypothetical protein
LTGRAPKNARIRNDDFRPMLEHPLDRLRRIAGLSHHLNVRLIFEQTPQPLPQQNVIMHQHAPNVGAADVSFALVLCRGVHFPSLKTYDRRSDDLRTLRCNKFWPEYFDVARQAEVDPGPSPGHGMLL